jgi:hypothetical protein
MAKASKTAIKRETILKSENRSVTFVADKEGKIRMTCGAWPEDRRLTADQGSS